MRKAAAVFALLAIAALAAFGPPVKAPKITGSYYAAGTVVWVKWGVSATPSDSLTVDLSATGQASAHRMYVADAKTDSISYPKPAPGASISGTLLVKNWKGGRSAPASANWGPYIEPDTVVVTPKVDSLIVRPSAWTGTYGQGTVFCAVTRTTDGVWHLPSVTDNPTFCQQVLAAVQIGA